MNDNNIVNTLRSESNIDSDVLHDKNTAHLFIHHNKVISSRLLKGINVNVNELKDGVSLKIRIDDNTCFEYPVHFCFGMLPEKGIQRINLELEMGKNSEISVIAHCTFPNPVDIQHIMDANIKIGENSKYSYFERHVHGYEGGIKVYPKAIIKLDEGARFHTEFELLKGRVGIIDIDYEAYCSNNSTMEMNARINGKGDDKIKIKETGYLNGANSKGVLRSRIALRQNSEAEVYNKIVASAPYARGHVDCQEIVQDNGKANAVPVVEVNHPKAHVTHEAAIGSVDSKQLETLMSRGLSEEDAVELIINGLLS